uniref:BED-type domain-containing protein n=1 Tax=Knipowitschia caucasica TaxID=637954 RepID=A0AAV2LII1_KNICA
MDLIGKPRSKSVVWMYFGFRADENGFPLRSDEVICRLCRKIVLAKGGNTTNLRSHLKRRHRAEVANTPFSASLGIGPETHDLGHSHEELIQELQSLSAQTETNQNYVPDAVLPPGEPWTNGGPSRAVLSLPSCLSLSEHSGNQVSSPSSESPAREMKVIARCQLQIGTMFGPYVGEMCRGHVPDNLAHAWAIRDESAFIYVDGTDLNKSNWMRFVTFTSYEDEQNLTVFQFYRKIYYKVSQPISEGDDLKVWVGRDYASLLGLEHTGENMKCQVGDKESFLRSLQDIQFSTLPEPTTSALWSDNSQSQSPMPIISEVTSINTSGGTEPISTAVPSSSHSYFPVPHPYENKYHFLPGTERLVGHPDHLHLPMSGDGSLWYFFGFEPDHNGRPLDRGNAICKLCGELVFCGSGGLIEIKNHMGNKHHIKPRESTNTSIIRPGSVQRTVLPPVTTTHSSANLTDNILYFLIMDLQPPSVVRGKGFQHLINTLLPNKVDLPSKTKLDYLLKDMHAKGKTDLAQTLRTKTETADYTAPLESERNRRRKDVRHLVNFSVDVWFHTWQGNTEMYLSLWVHYMDANFICHNQALASQKLSKSGLNLKAVESQVRAMAEIWGISQANLTVLGGEGWNDIRAIPMFSGLLTRHLVTRPGDSPILKEAKTMMRYNLSDWYGSPTVNRVLNVACALDPQFHGVGFMSEQEQSETYQWLKNEAVRISNEAQTKLRLKKSQPEDGNKRSPSPSTPDESRRRSKRLKDSQPINFCDIDVSEGEGSDVDWVEPPPGDGLSGMQFLLGDLYSTGTRSKQKSVEESVELEINVFRSDNGATLGVEPLQWWRSKTLQLPLLATVAQAYLSAPAVAGNAAHGYLQDGAGTSRGKRSNIPPENLDAILFLHHNNFHKSKLKLY